MTALSARVRLMTQRARQQNVFFFYVLSSLGLQVATMFATFAVLAYVPPEDMGIWRTMVLVNVYLNFVTLGAPNGLARELPYLLGRGDKGKALRLAGVTQFYMIAVGMAGVFGFFLPLILYPFLPHEWVIALLTMIVYWFFSEYKSYLGVTFRSEREFRRLTYVNISDFVLNVVSLLLVVWGGYEGMLLRVTLLTVSSVAMMFFLRPLRVRPHFKADDLGVVLATGIPQYFGGYFIMTSLAFEQTIILQSGGTNQVGLYTAVAAVTTAMTAVQASIVSYINPRIMYKLGKTQDTRWVLSDVWAAALLLAAISLPIAVIGIVVTQHLLPVLFPAYVGVLPAVQIALIGGVFLAMNTTTTGLYALKAWRFVALYAVIMMISRWVLPSLFVQYGMGELTARVAAGGAAANALVFFLGILFVLWAARRVHQPSSIPDAPVNVGE